MVKAKRDEVLAARCCLAERRPETTEWFLDDEIQVREWVVRSIKAAWRINLARILRNSEHMNEVDNDSVAAELDRGRHGDSD